MFGFFRPGFLAPDTGAAGGEAAAAAAQDSAADTPTQEGAATAPTPPAQGAAPAPAPQAPPPAQDAAPASPPAAPPPAQAAPPAAEPPAPDIAALTQRAVTAELRAAAALAGVPEAKMSYVARLAQIQGADAPGADLAALAKAAVEQVLADIPELRGGGLNLGGSGDHVRAPEASPEEQARKTFAANL